MQYVETIEYKGHEISIYQDETVESPVDTYDMLGKMVCSHSRYNLGHVQVEDGMDGWYDHLASEHDLVYRNDWYPEEHGKVEYEDYVQKWVEANLIILPLYLYDHSGITMNTKGFHCQWDSGQVGFVYVSKQKAKEEWKWNKLSKKRVEKIRDILRSEVQTYDHYLTGSVYGYSIEGDHSEDSCWGYYGSSYDENSDWEYMIQCAKDNIDAGIKHDRKSHFEQLKDWIKNKVPLVHRHAMA